MTPEHLEFIACAAVAGFLLGLLVTVVAMSVKRKTLEAANSLLGTELATALADGQDLQQKLGTVNARLQQLRVDQAGQTARLNLLVKEHHQVSGHKVRLEQQARQLQIDLGNSREALSAAGAELVAEKNTNRAQTADAAQRLEELKAVRLQLSSEKDNLAALDKYAKGMEVTATQADKSGEITQQALHSLQAKFDNLQHQYNQQTADYAQLKTSLAERDTSHKAQLAQLDQNKQALTKEFENLANKIFEQKGRAFADTNKSSLDTLLKPFRDQIDGFQRRINEVHDVSLQGSARLNAEIKKVLDIGLKMSSDATNLTSALKGDSQQRGAWGEVQLQRTLEMSGLVQEAHFDKQSSFKDAEGKQKQTDYTIKLPGDKHIIIDSKVSLVAYDKAIAAQTDEEYIAAMAAHGKAIKAHIDDLARKDYTNVIGMLSPSFVLMFMPIEPAYIEALKHNKDLFGYGYGKNVVLVSHTTLIPILRTVSNLWVMEQSNNEAREISDRAGDIYNSVCMVAERLLKLGNTMNTASTHYNDTVKALVGQQGLHGKVDRFTQLSNKVSKSLPELEQKHIDFETDRLTLLAEPVHATSTPQLSADTNALAAKGLA